MTHHYSNYSFRQLAQKHEHTSSLYEKTRIEEAMWNQLSPDERRSFGDRGHFVKATFGTSIYDAASRVSLLNAGSDARALWDRIEKGLMKITTAVRLVRAARKQAIKNNTTVKHEVGEQLAVYDKLPKTIDGTRRRKQPSHTRLSRRPKRRKGGQHKQLRQVIADYVSDQLPDGDLSDYGALISQLETDIKVAVDTFSQRLKATQERIARTQQSATRRQLREAFETLLLEPPRRGKPIDIEAVRKNKRRLAREYHPDMNNGDESMAEAYRAVISAADLIEAEYERQP